MSRRMFVATALAATATLLGSGMPGFSGATFTSSSTATATVGAAADWTPPTVTLLPPPAAVQGTVALVAEAADGESGIRDVAFELASGGGWVTLCTTATAPYSCTWDTRTLADGPRTLRATATDNEGYVTASAAVATVVANDVIVVLASPGEVVRGTVPLTATVHGAGTVGYAVRFEYASAGTGQWRTLCTDSTAPYSCSWATTSVANDDYDVRAVAVSGATAQVSATVAVLVDNMAPTVTAQVPGSPLRGTVVLGATAVDDDSGIAAVVWQYAGATGGYRDLCTDTEEPFTCRFDTATVIDGTYAFRAVATDLAGNSTTSVVVNRTVDNTASSVAVDDPGAVVAGTITVTAVANSTAGVTSVRIQRAPSGTSTWVDLCTDTAAPFSCSWDTTTVPDGLYDLRAVLVDGTGAALTSATVAGRRVDNNPLRGVEVQTVSGGATPGRLDAGDRITFLYNDRVDLGTISAGWVGEALPVTLRLRDGRLVGLGNTGDSLDVLRNKTSVNLGSVNLRGDYIKNRRTVELTATLVATTTTVNGVPATLVTLTVGEPQTGQVGWLRIVTAPSTMLWTPSGLARDTDGRSASTVPVTEPGAPDREF